MQQLESERIRVAAHARGPRFSIAPKSALVPEIKVPEQIILDKTEVSYLSIGIL